MESSPSYSSQESGVLVTSTITKQQIENEGTLKAYVTYFVSSEYSNGQVSVVARRYSDFEWLNAVLEEEYKSILIPPLPPKDGLGRFDYNVVQYRIREFNRFLSRILAHPILSKNINVDTFLRSKDEDLTISQNKKSPITSVIELFDVNLVKDTATKVGHILVHDVEEVDEWFNTTSEYFVDLGEELEEVSYTSALELKYLREGIVTSEAIAEDLKLLANLENDINVSGYLKSYHDLLSKEVLLTNNLINNQRIVFEEICEDQERLSRAGYRILENRLDHLLSYDIAHTKATTDASTQTEKLALEKQEAEEKERVERQNFDEFSRMVKYELDEFKSQKSQEMRKAILQLVKENIKYGEQVIDLWKELEAAID